MSEPDPKTLTQLLKDTGAGAEDARELLFQHVYEELRGLARAQFRKESPNHTLQATALVHEAYLRLMQSDQLDLCDRAHFFALAAQVMRKLLVDHYRRRHAQKRGGGWQRITLGHASDPADELAVDVLSLDEALEKLTALDARKSRVVELRFFGGMSVEEVAGALNVSPRTVESDWHFARAWLRRELG